MPSQYVIDFLWLVGGGFILPVMLVIAVIWFDKD